MSVSSPHRSTTAIQPPPAPRQRVAVFCGARAGDDPRFSALATALGDLLGRRGIGLVTGGGHVGLMGVVSDAALAAGGHVTGVIPRALQDRELAHAALSELHVVNGMHERKALMHALSGAFVALPGGYGTLEELFEALTWLQLGFHAKPCALLGPIDFWGPLATFLDGMTNSGLLRAEHRALLPHFSDIQALQDEFLPRLLPA